MEKITYEHKYKLGELVWIRSPDGIEIEVRIQSVMLNGESISYQYSGAEVFWESEVIDKSESSNDVLYEKEIRGFNKWCCE